MATGTNTISVIVALQTANAIHQADELVNKLTERFLSLEAAKRAAEYFMELAHASFELQDRLWILHERTGQTVENLNGLVYVAGRSDIGFEQLEKSLKKFSEWMTKSGQGSKDLTEALLEQADIFSKMPDGVGKTALAVERFGRFGDALIPLLREGGEGITGLIQRGGDLTGITSDMARGAHEAGEAWKDFRLSMQGFAGMVGTVFLPRGTELLNWLTKTVVELRSGWQYLMGGTAMFAEALGKGLFSDLAQDKEKNLNIDKADYELQKDALELKLKDVELQQKLTEQDVAINAEDKQRLINLFLSQRIGLLYQLNELTEKAERSGAITEKDSLTQSAGIFSKIGDLSGKQSPEGLFGNIQQSFQKWANASGTLFQQIADNLVNIVGGAIKTVSSNLTAVIMQTQTWNQALIRIGNTILTHVIDAILEMGIKWVVTHVLMGGALAAFHALARALGWGTTTQQIAQEQAKAVPMAVTASLASVSSFGASAIIGIAALVAALGVGVAAASGAFRERGGTVERGMPYIVGERRAEVFVPTQGGTIMPSASGIGGGTNVHVGILNDRSDIPNWARSREGESHIIDIIRRNHERI